jgi:putative transposase
MTTSINLSSSLAPSPLLSASLTSLLSPLIHRL